MKLKILLILKKSASYLDIHIETNNRGILKIKLYDFTFPIVNFPFISSNISASPAYGVNIILELVSSTVIFWTELSYKRKNYSNKATLLLD